MDDEGASSPLAFIVAGVIFLGAIALILGVVYDRVPPPSAAQQVDSGHGLEARTLLESFVKSTTAPGLLKSETTLSQDRIKALELSNKDALDGASMQRSSAWSGNTPSVFYDKATRDTYLQDSTNLGFRVVLNVQVTDDVPYQDRCAPMVFGGAMPFGAPAEAVSTIMRLDGDPADACAHATGFVEVTVIVFDAEAAS